MWYDYSYLYQFITEVHNILDIQYSKKTMNNPNRDYIISGINTYTPKETNAKIIKLDPQIKQTSS